MFETAELGRKGAAKTFKKTAAVLRGELLALQEELRTSRAFPVILVFAGEEQWRRSYGEINDFEHQLIERGIVLVKYWIHISKDERRTRFKGREKAPYERWKLTEEDWRNRAKWDACEQAVNDRVQYTSTSAAPWTLVEGNDKRYARVKVIETFCDRLTAALDGARD